MPHDEAGGGRVAFDVLPGAEPEQRTEQERDAGRDGERERGAGEGEHRLQQLGASSPYRANRTRLPRCSAGEIRSSLRSLSGRRIRTPNSSSSRAPTRSGTPRAPGGAATGMALVTWAASRRSRTLARSGLVGRAARTARPIITPAAAAGSTAFMGIIGCPLPGRPGGRAAGRAVVGRASCGRCGAATTGSMRTGRPGQSARPVRPGWHTSRTRRCSACSP